MLIPCIACTMPFPPIPTHSLPIPSHVIPSHPTRTLVHPSHIHPDSTPYPPIPASRNYLIPCIARLSHVAGHHPDDSICLSPLFVAGHWSGGFCIIPYDPIHTPSHPVRPYAPSHHISHHTIIGRGGRPVGCQRRSSLGHVAVGSCQCSIWPPPWRSIYPSLLTPARPRGRE